MKEEYLNIVNSELQSLKERIAQNILNNRQNASGRSIASLNVVQNDNGSTLFGRPFFGTFEAGRRPGGIPHGFVGIILQWMIDKGITASAISYKRLPSNNWQPKYTSQERGNLSLASAIANKIKKEGTALYRIGGRSDVYSSEIPTTIENIKSKLLSLVVLDYKSIKLN